MKKQHSIAQIIVILLVCSFVFTSCSNPKKISSNLNISKVESALDIEFTETKEDDGYSYKAKDPHDLYDISYSAIADSEKNVSSITITNKGVDTSYLTDEKTFKELMNTNADDFTRKGLKAAMCALEVMNLMDAFGLDGSTTSKDEAISVLAALFQGEKITVEKWTIEADIDKSGEKVVINAYFG